MFLHSRISEIHKDDDLIKFILRLADGFEIESVVIPSRFHTTVCVSSQAGCRMGCSFCETGRRGFRRNLTADEIVEQVHAAKHVSKGDIRNVVFMGMGEPLDNVESVLGAIHRLTDPKGLRIARRHITVSTVGLPAGLRALAGGGLPGSNLAVSLNAPNDPIRTRIMPINQIWPMAELKAALLAYPIRPSRAFLIEYVLIKNLNDAQAHAHQLADFLKPLNTKVNVIPLNRSTDCTYPSPSDAEADRFCAWLKEKNLFARRRSGRGRSVLGACGQLGGSGMGKPSGSA